MGILDIADRVERIAVLDTREAVELRNAIHNLLPEPKCVQPPDYLRSIDAAMTLCRVRRIIINIAEDGITMAIVDGTQGCAATPALALTAASLRAMAGGEDGNV